MEQLLYGKARKVKRPFGGKTMNLTVEGVIEKFTHKYIKRDLKTIVRAHTESGRAVHHRGAMHLLQRRATKSGRAELQDQWTQHCGDVLHGGRTS